VVTSSVWLLSVVVATRTSRPRVVSTTVYSTGLDREARGEGVPDRQRLAGCRRGLGGVPLALIHAVLTHKSEREELNLKPKPDLKSAEDCQTEPQRSTSEAEGDGTFDAAAIVTRVDTDRDFEEH
jgi:hypothetical protein